MNTYATTLDETRYKLFNTTAPRYNELIMPAFGPLAEGLVALAALSAEDVVLDLGAGTGAAAFPASQQAGQVVGLDYASAMLPRGHHKKVEMQADHLSFCQGDMHRLPFASHTFSAALASFGFNGVEPQRAFPEAWRVLQPGGRLVLQEWGQVDEASKRVKQAVKRHKVAEAAGFLADLRLLGATPKPWDLLGSPEQIAARLRQDGFTEVKITLAHPTIPLDPRTFYHYKTAWAPYQAELTAMLEVDRLAVQQEVLDYLRPNTDAEGRFGWQPEVIQMVAWKGD